ncbi:MAG: hypothetical protein L0229_12585, partial [Blastocatellia bacterium]|nr:hypothetical protein [Blastocatellia bacterium]
MYQILRHNKAVVSSAIGTKIFISFIRDCGIPCQSFSQTANCAERNASITPFFLTRGLSSNPGQLQSTWERTLL